MRRTRSSPGNIDFNPGWHTALDLHNLLTVSEAIARAAIERKESRGGQFRDDYPGQRIRNLQSSISRSKRRTTARCRSATIPIPEMPAELKQVIEEMG